MEFDGTEYNPQVTNKDKDNWFYSPIGSGVKVHIFLSPGRALCLRGPALTHWTQTANNEVCQECLRKLQKVKKP